jgi:hypothetical protein
MLAVRLGVPDGRTDGGTDESTERALAALGRYGAVHLVALPATADRAVLDDVLSGVAGRRLVVLADLAGLNLVVHRLLRRSLLAGTPVGAVIDDPAWNRAVGLPGDPVAAAEVAATGSPARLRLVREDHGGIVLREATLRPAAGRRFGVRAYVEDTELVDARTRTRTLTVAPDGHGLVATVRRGGVHPARTLHGRAVTLRCQEARLAVDGRELPDLRSRATWWCDRDSWQLVRPRV